jgi:hypothetical protein
MGTFGKSKSGTDGQYISHGMKEAINTIFWLKKSTRKDYLGSQGIRVRIKMNLTGRD